MPDPTQLSSVPASEPASIPTLDGWIESLMNCKQLAESDVQRLCDKVHHHNRDGSNNTHTLTRAGSRLARCSRKSPMYSQWYVRRLQNSCRS